MKPDPIDLKNIEEAVMEAEKRTVGEVVPLIYDKCSHTQFVFPFLAILVSSILYALQGAFFPVNYWDANWFLQLLLPALFALLISLLASKLDVVQRVFLSKARREKAVKEKAELEFYRCGVSGTKEKTGVLIFVSLMERYSVVLADKAISEKLPPETWNEVLNTLNSKLSTKSLSKGFLPAIKKCGDILEAHFPRKPDNTDELPNYPILRRLDD